MNPVTASYGVTGAVGQVVNETVAQFLEKAQRPGLLGLAGKTAQRRCQKDLASYFHALGSRIKQMKFEQLAHADRGLEVEPARHMVELRMHNLLRNRRPFLVALLQSHLIAAIHQANAVSLLAEADGDPEEEDPGLSGDEAAEWAAAHVDQAITGLDETSQQLIADAVAKGIKDRLGVSGTAQLIADAVGAMSSSRAETIAATEMNMAMSYGFLQKLTRNGVEYKQWILGPNPCEVCEENAAASPIPVDEDFPSGDDAPPAHPNCVCAVAGAHAPDE